MLQSLVKDRIREFVWQHKARSIRMGVGCAHIGIGKDHKENLCHDLSLLEASYEAGFRYYDTSRSYNHSELVLGEFIKNTDRDTLFIATKSRFPFTEPDGFEIFKKNFYESFERLQTDRIDLFQIHDTNHFRVCEEKVLPFLLDRKREGLIDYIGLGMRAQTAHQQGILSGHIDSNLSYMDYNLVRLSAKPTIELAKRHKTAFINASVLLFGLFKNERAVEPHLGSAKRFAEFASKMQSLIERMHVNVFAASYQYSLLNPNIDLTLFGLKRMSNLLSLIDYMEQSIMPEQWSQIFALQQTYEGIDVEEELAP